MLCEECKVNEATVLITMVIQGEKRTKHLCQGCVDRIKENFEQGDIQSFLSSLMELLPKTQPAEEVVCSSCHLAYSTFQKTGKLGCAQCYIDFKEQLQPLLSRIHGRVQHAGRVPVGFEKQEEKVAQSPGTNQEEENLRKQMEAAVQEENFEQAAFIRDKLKDLLEKTEVNHD